jgi:hypothetical protein
MFAVSGCILLYFDTLTLIAVSAKYFHQFQAEITVSTLAHSGFIHILPVP